MVEDRTALSLAVMMIELTQRDAVLALEVVDRADLAAPGPSPLDERIVAALADATGLMPLAELRLRCHVRDATLTIAESGSTSVDERSRAVASGSRSRCRPSVAVLLRQAIRLSAIYP